MVMGEGFIYGFYGYTDNLPGILGFMILGVIRINLC